MDVVVICNGLGNQMSQYAFYLQKKSIKENTEFILFCNDHNGLELDSVFGIDCRPSLKKKLLYTVFRILLTNRAKHLVLPLKNVLNYFSCKIVKENFQYNFNSNFLEPAKGISFFFGGWHSELYFKKQKEVIKSVYAFKNHPGDKLNKEYLDKISNSNSVSLHIRRGDFMDINNINLFGSICNIDYYKFAISEFKKRIQKPHFFVFSNDMEWVKENLKVDLVTYIEGNFGDNSWIDLYLMSKCKNHIIANSSFSWWGAWLNSSSNKIVICPIKFSSNDINSDVYPIEWIKI